MLQKINDNNPQYKYKGDCLTCCKITTFNEFQYCNECGNHYYPEVNEMNQQMGSFTANDILKEKEYVQPIPQDIIDDLTNTNQEPAPAYVPKNTKNKFKKQNIMKKSIINFGKGLAKGTCKTLGGIHFVVQTGADAIADTEAVIRERAFNEDKEEAFINRKLRTAEHQMNLLQKFSKEKLCVKNV